MNFESVDLRILVENVFATTLGMTVTPAMANDEWPPRRAAVAIRGSWSGRVVVATNDSVLRSTVASMCHVHPHECGDNDLQDALLELTNVLGGSVKSLLPEDCRLGLPEILSGPAPSGEADADRTFRCDGQAVRLRVEGSQPA